MLAHARGTHDGSVDLPSPAARCRCGWASSCLRPALVFPKLKVDAQREQDLGQLGRGWRSRRRASPSTATRTASETRWCSSSPIPAAPSPRCCASPLKAFTPHLFAPSEWDPRRVVRAGRSAHGHHGAAAALPRPPSSRRLRAYARRAVLGVGGSDPPAAHPAAALHDVLFQVLSSGGDRPRRLVLRGAGGARARGSQPPVPPRWRRWRPPPPPSAAPEGTGASVGAARWRVPSLDHARRVHHGDRHCRRDAARRRRRRRRGR